MCRVGIVVVVISMGECTKEKLEQHTNDKCDHNQLSQAGPTRGGADEEPVEKVACEDGWPTESLK